MTDFYNETDSTSALNEFCKPNQSAEKLIFMTKRFGDNMML